MKQSRKSLVLLLIFDRNPPLIEMKSYNDSTTVINKCFHGTRRKSSENLGSLEGFIVKLQTKTFQVNWKPFIIITLRMYVIDHINRIIEIFSEFKT